MDSEDDITDTQPAPLIAAGELLASKKAFGLIWLDDELYVRARYGPLVEHVEIGEPVTDSMIALIGMEEELFHLRNGPDRNLYLPAVAMMTAQTKSLRLNLTFFWSNTDRRYLALVARAMSSTGIEEDLSKQMRARLIAETEVAEKSRALSQANSELARANRDLEDYATIISHDLNAPLRGLRYIADELEAAILAKDDNNTFEKLSALKAQSRRMSQLMTGLLNYASVGGKDDAIEFVDTKILCAMIAKSFSHIPHLKIDITGKWPKIPTLRAPLDLVLRNLIDNAIKHHDLDQCHICLVGIETDKMLNFSVQDDGPGIDPKHHDAIFLPFRTASRHRDEGRGMGLALVKKTLETVGGEIKLSSDPSRCRGTKIFVKWPITAKAPVTSAPI